MPADTVSVPGERLQKVLARAGLASRRKCEAYILEGRVSVNGQIVRELGTRVLPDSDRIEVDGKSIAPKESQGYYLLYKPVGYLSAVSDPRGSPVARTLVPGQKRLYPVGRLDLPSEGLLLFTNDGELAQRLTHPRYAHHKEYLVLVQGRVSAQEAQRLSRGIVLDEGERPVRAEVKPLPIDWRWRDEPIPRGCHWLRVLLKEGRKRQIRRMLQALGYSAARIIRVRMGTLRLGDLAPGEGRWLTPEELTSLRRSVGLDSVGD